MSEKDIKIYHVETQEDYDDLMAELEEQGYVWRSHAKPTKYTPRTKPPAFIFCRDRQRKEITIGTKRDVEECYLKEVVRHKAEGVKQMEKVVVPQFVADWYEQYKEGYTLYGILSELTDEYYYSIGKLDEWIRSVNNARNDDGLANVQEIVAKMYLHGYEVEKEKKYYWRKKKEYSFNFEHHCSNNYLNLDGDGRLFFSDKAEFSLCTTKFTETKLRELVSKEDFSKLEKVEITE